MREVRRIELQAKLRNIEEESTKWGSGLDFKIRMKMGVKRREDHCLQMHFADEDELKRQTYKDLNVDLII